MIRKLFVVAATLALVGASPADAGKLRLAFHGGGLAPVGPPSSQVMDMGSETFRGYGGMDPCTTWGATAVVSQSNAGGAVSTFAVRPGTNFIAYAGSYGTLPPATTGPYSINLTCGAYPVTLTVNIIPGRFDVREDPADTPSVNQPTQVLAKTVVAGGPSCGEEVVFRPGEWNMTQQDRRIEPPADSAMSACFTGSNYIVVRAERYLETKIGRLILYGNTGRRNAYMHFKDLWLQRPNLGMAGPDGSAFQGTAGPSMFKISHSLIESIPGATDGHTVFSGIYVTGDQRGSCKSGETPNPLQYASRSQNIVIEDVDIRGVYQGVSINGSGITLDNIRISDVWDDGVHLFNTWDINARWIYILNQKSLPVIDDAHPDGIQATQDAMCAAQGYPAGSYTWGNWYGIMIARGSGSAGIPAGQGLFLSDATPGVLFTNFTLRGFFYQGTAQRGISLSNFDNPVIEWVTLVKDTSPDVSAGVPAMYFDGGLGGTVRYSATGAAPTLEGTQTPLTVDTNNFVVTTGGYSTAYLAPTYGAPLNTVAGVNSAFGMLPGGTMAGSPNAGALGTGYIDFVNRTASFPP